MASSVTVPKGVISKRFGNQATISKMPDARNGKIINPEIPPQIFEMYWTNALGTLQRWNGDGVQKLINPRTVIAVDDRGIYLDQICDAVDLVAGLEWEQSGFNLNGYRENIRRGIQLACEWWADDEWKRFLYITQGNVEETKSKAE